MRPSVGADGPVPARRICDKGPAHNQLKGDNMEDSYTVSEARAQVGVSGVFFPNRGSHGLAPEHFTIAELLKSVGYKTLAAGKWHLGGREGKRESARDTDLQFG